MITTTYLIIVSRHRKPDVALATIFITSVLSYSAHSSIPRVPGAIVLRGRTPSGHACLSGGFSFEEQRPIERVGHLRNLRIAFTRPVGSLSGPVFLMIGFNNGQYKR